MKSRILTEKQRKEFFDILGNPPSFTTDVFVKLFAYTKEGNGIRFYTDDIITIGPEDYPGVKPGSKTRVGRFIVNKFIFEPLSDLFGYVNVELNNKSLGKLSKLIEDALRAGDLEPTRYHEIIDRRQYLFGGAIAHIINTSLSPTLLTLPPAAKKLRNDMIKERKERLDSNDPIASAEIENAVVTKALEEMRKTNDPAIGLYDAGAGIDPYNHFRTMFVMKGAIKDNTGESPTGYKIVKSNYDDGITKEDLAVIADSLVTSAHSRGVMTQDSGADSKTYNTLYQNIKIQPKGTFCGTKRTEQIQITEENKKKYLYRYIKTGATNPVMLSPENIDSYVGKTVNMYTPIYCQAHDPEYCSICSGESLVNEGIKYIGLTFSASTGAMMNAALKIMHDSRVKNYKVTIEDIMRYIDHPLV